MSDRLVIVLGMAHSGTTILTHLLRQHPSLHLCANGGNAWLLENDWLLAKDQCSILNALKQHERVLLKRPWTEYRALDWLIETFPNAWYIYCYKDCEDIIQSWSRTDTNCEADLRDAPMAEKRAFYEHCRRCAITLWENVAHFRVVHHPYLARHPADCMVELRNWLGLSAFIFDVSAVVSGVDIKKVLTDLPSCSNTGLVPHGGEKP